MAGTSYLKLSPGKDSQFGFENAQELFSFLATLPGKDQFKLIIRVPAQNDLRYLIGASEPSVSLLKKHLLAICPTLNINVANKSDLLTNPQISRWYIFNRHYSFPLYDPSKSDDKTLSRLLQHFSQLDKKQALELELSFQPADPLKAKLLRHWLIAGHQFYFANSTFLRLISYPLITIGRLSSSTSRLLGGQKTSRSTKVTNQLPVKLLDKLYQPLFKTTLELRIKAATENEALKLLSEIELSLNNFAQQSGDQILKPTTKTRPDIYSAADLAAFCHFSVEDLRSGIFELADFKNLPLAKKLSYSHKPNQLLLGFNEYQGKKQDLAISQADRMRHIYICGATGSGKSTLLENLVRQDILAGRGLTLIDPHGDLAKSVIDHLPPDRLPDVWYFDPADRNCRLAINLLEIKADKGSWQYQNQAELVTESVISLMRKLFSTDDSNPHRLEYILRNTIQTSLALPDSTIFTIYNLLTDNQFRNQAVNSLTDPNLINFWRNELGRAGDYQRVKMTAGITAKIGRLLFSEAVKRVFNQPKSNFDFNNLIRNKKILIANFSKGRLGEDGSKLFSIAVMTMIQLSALARADQAPESRAEHYLYVDEFQNYTPSLFNQLLSESRKYGLYLTMAEQSPSQQDSLQTSIILANTGNLICFRSSSPKDEALLLPSFDNYLSASDLANLPAYCFYFKSRTEQVMPPTSARIYPPENSSPRRNQLSKKVKPSPQLQFDPSVLTT